MQRIAIIDYGMGNLQSVSKALEQVAPYDEVVVTDDPGIIQSADRIVCPGQGAAADCMGALLESGLAQAVVDTVHTRPFLGICMGFQVLLMWNRIPDRTRFYFAHSFYCIPSDQSLPTEIFLPVSFTRKRVRRMVCSF